jgi:hypothetical protein
MAGSTAHRIGRRPKLEPWRVERYMQALRLLAPQHVCAAYARVSQRTVQRWLAQGRADREQRDESAPPSAYEMFLAEYEKTEAEAELRMLGQIALAGEKNWTAMAWILERRRPSDYSRRWVTVGESGPSLDPAELAGAIVRAQAEVQASVPKEPVPKRAS